MPKNPITAWMIFGSICMNGIELFLRVIPVMLFYWKTESQVLTILMVLCMRFVPTRMTKYYQMWHFKIEGGAYYTEIFSPMRILEFTMIAFIILVVVQALAYVIVPKKDFLK